MVLFAKSIFRQTNEEAANTFSSWTGTLYISSLIGAFLSDSYLGRCLTCVVFQVVSVIGLVALSISTHLFMLKPQGCGKIGQLCDPHSSSETALFYISIYLIAIGNGTPEPALATFGADQFDEEDPQEKQSKSSFFSYFYVALNLGCLYRRFRPSGNPLSRFSQVIVASMRKINLQVPSNGEELYVVHERENETICSRRILHTNDFKFLDRAAIMTPYGFAPLSSLAFTQMIGLFIEQGAALDTKISNFQIPPASMIAFDIISTIAFILLYNKLIVPLYVKLIKREPKTPSELRRIGIGLSIAILAMLIAGMVEQHRLKYASKNSQETSSLSILWLTPQYMILGVAEAFLFVAQMEFLSSQIPQIPDGLKSLGIALSMSSTAISSYVCSMILTVVMAITTKNGEPGWVPPNLNDGHLDRFFFLCAGLTALNLDSFIICAKCYKCISMEKWEEAQPSELKKAML
ncbi:hypothetical protein EZV62_009673 [Acer yangbiense]|uniref:Major facilitator superfamily (MFS) profile domain-containing protein n=1 Tax=Acer yangbiense TaxID=1000413 RepID=A0A5C7I0Y1_9ROSI|nr:hypothetical protein EZV62_009673 [Acer yangbiense]